MKKLAPCLAAFTLFSLAACGGASSDNSTSAGGPQPGMYQQVVKVTTLEFPGMTADMKRQTIQQMEQGTAGGSFCIGSGEDRDWKEAAKDISSSLGGQCTEVKNVGSSTSVDMEMNCKNTANGDATIKLNGSASGDGYKVVMDTAFVDPRTNESAKVAFDISAKRQGDCPGA
jgi:hypothetical protein